MRYKSDAQLYKDLTVCIIKALPMLVFILINFNRHYIWKLWYSFYRIFFYPIIFILSPFSTNHITSCLGSRVDMVSNLNSVSMIFALSLQ